MRNKNEWDRPVPMYANDRHAALSQTYAMLSFLYGLYAISNDDADAYADEYIPQLLDAIQLLNGNNVTAYYLRCIYEVTVTSSDDSKRANDFIAICYANKVLAL